MTLVSEIIRDAYRESNLISITADPTQEEQDEGLRLLNRLVQSSYGSEAGEQLDPIAIGQANISRPQGWPYYNQTPDMTEWFVPINSRLMLNLSSPLTVYLDPQPIDGARFAITDNADNLSTFPLTVVANGRQLDGDLQKVYNTSGANVEFMYRDDIGEWLVVTPLEADGTFPFPVDFDDLFTIGLSMRLNPRHAATADPQSTAAYSKLLSQFKARYRQSRQMGAELGIVRTPGNRKRYYDDTRYSNSLFNSGWASLYGGYRW